MKKLLALIVVLAAALAGWFWLKRSDDPKVPFAKATREKISNVLSTNGKVEPAQYIDVHVESSGLVKRLLVHAGDPVRKDQILAELGEPGLQQELEAAAARESQARANLQTLQAGGRSADTAELDGSLNRLKSGSRRRAA